MKLCAPFVVVSAVLVTAGSSARAEDQAIQFCRDAARLNLVRKAVLAPVVVQLRFDRSKELPDPNRLAARIACMSRAQTVLGERLKGARIELVPADVGAAAMREMNLAPVQLYATRSDSTWDAPAETIRGKKGDQAQLLASRDSMKGTPAALTCYRYRWHDLPDVDTGLAAFQADVFAPLDLEKVKSLGARTGADAVLLVQVTDLEVHSGSGMFGGFRSTRLTLQAMLAGAGDGAIIWQARAKGIVSQKAGYFTGARAYKPEDRAAIEAMTKAVELLLADLMEGRGKPAAASTASH